ncbi:MAG: DUF1549 and DUF1553 domain-containing protein, partial [Verrucomicrobiota bacterium]
PPPDIEKPLSAAQKEKIRLWIEAGAPYQKHWSLVPPTRPVPPSIHNEPPSVAVENPIDAFIFHRLAEEGLSPAPAASRETLLRRLTFDLTGLPPTLEEIDQFLADRSPTAYEKVVDRLLDSPRFGEHQAWTWLDAARYSDTNGYQGDRTRVMWPWRRWVIDAYNRNLPFDQFTIQQLAGDLLPDRTPEEELASGFNRNHPLNGEGGRIAEESRVDYVIDRVETTSTVWMGLTAGCARCHDHKYDPLSQKEFYQLYAFFNNIEESGSVDAGGNAKPVFKYPLPGKAEEVAALRKELKSKQASLKVPVTPEETKAIHDWQAVMKEQHDATAFTDWSYLGPIKTGDFKSGHEKQWEPEKAGKAVPVNGLKWTERPEWKDGLIQTKAIPETSVGFLHRQVTVGVEARLRFQLGADDGFRFYHNGKKLADKVTNSAPNLNQAAIEIDLSPGTHDLLLKVTNNGGDGGFVFDWSLAEFPQTIETLLAKTQAERSPGEQEQLLVHFRTRTSHALEPFQKLDREIKQLSGKLAEKEKGASIETMVMRERKKIRPTYVLKSGRYDDHDKSETLTPELPDWLLSPEGQHHNRLTMAQWLMNPDHPLTARVAVNRYWQNFFGFGLVKTSEDFGSQGELPSHPGLLDWLATEYMRLKWDRKALYRTILTSATYRQSSDVSPGVLESDPYNRLLSRGPRFRLPAHQIRDQALSISGLYIEETGGPSVKPYQPAGLWADFSFGRIRYEQDKGASLYRRSLYTFWRRSLSSPNMFDAANRQVCNVRPRRNNTPLQSLTLMNDITYLEASRNLAERLLTAHSHNRKRLQMAFRLATSRLPDATEMQVLTDALTSANRHFSEHPDDARELITVGESTPIHDLDPMEVAGLTIVVSTVLNLDESI